MDDVMSNFATYGYIALFFYSLGGGFIGIVAAGILSHLGEMDISISIIVAIIANFLGDIMLFYLGRYNKKEVMGYFKKHRRKLALTHIWIKRYGDKVIFIQKYIYGIKTLVPLVIGLTKYELARFIPLNAMASVLWGISFGLAAYFAGAVLKPAVIYLSSHYYILIALLILLGGGLYLLMKKVTQK